ncbi:hypothetical protein Mterra_02871 [Calidithermus terrae]|uniref:Lipoprotein n=1 Tax=Calidithermus terrae TaxID=1408545 RepID=A0A399EBC7_9DEIN|nr:hypothetical protein [Calidithermus terrae]RIH81967.1 hypothetical protein Mterra_02871 [Calidithermus terrae]
MPKTLPLLLLLGLLGGCNLFTFRVSVAPQKLTVPQGDPEGATATVVLERAADFAAPVVCSLRPKAGGTLPGGLTAAFTPPVLEGTATTATLRVTAAEALDPPVSTLEAQVYCESGSLYNYADLTLVIQPKPTR